MKTKQRTFEGNSSYSYCERFIDNMMGIYDVKKILLEKLPQKDNDWVIKWRVIVYYA